MSEQMGAPITKPGHTVGDDISERIRDSHREVEQDYCHSCFDPFDSDSKRVNVPLPVPVHPTCAEREKRKK